MEDDMLDAPKNKLQEKDEKKVEEKSLEDRLNALQDL